MRKTLKDIIQNLLDPDTDMGCTVSFTDSESVEHEYILWDDAFWRTTMYLQFGKRVFDDWDEDSDEEALLNAFMASISAWYNSRKYTYAKRLFAFTTDFNPLENYRSTETREGSFTHGESVELSFTNRKDTQKDDSFVEKSFTNYKETEKDDSSTTRSFTDYEETYGNAQQTNEHKVSADDSGSYVPRAQDVMGSHDDTKSIDGTITDTKGFTLGDVKTIEGSIKDQHGFTTNGLTNEKAGKETTAHSGTDEDEYTLERFGNIGVTTSQQMLASDLDLLRYDIVMQAIKEWVSQYTFISEEVDY